ncbi:MAG TPA: sugar phosphate nucleotidyltransferase [Methylomirabilota bacterium]|nr:sugar phosphate nucleotidyltransferase [Methylomirabilota bacterium]
MTPAAAIILAGGDGTRLRPLTRRLAGDDRPKQFCALLGRETLLEQTRRRAARLIVPERTLFSVTRTHEPYYTAALASVPPPRLVAQPSNRGTAPAVLYALLRLHAVARTEAVVVLPSDHYVSDDDALMARVEGALDAVRSRPDVVVLLGVEPDRPEVQYGWIEPADLLLGRWAWPIYRVRRFWEKPPLEEAQRLLHRGSLWNSFVIVAHPAVLEGLICSALPSLAQAFEPLRGQGGTAWEDDVVRAVYRTLPARDLSRHVLQRHPERLAVLPVSGIGWNDLGDPARVLVTQERLAAASA